jgi:hypothetical protein
LNWWGIRALQLVGLARAVKRVHFDSVAAAWQLATGKRKRKNAYERA